MAIRDRISRWLLARAESHVLMSELRRLDVRAGDCLVLTTPPKWFTQPDMRAIQERCADLRERLGLRVFLVLESEMDVKVVALGEAAQALERKDDALTIAGAVLRGCATEGCECFHCAQVREAEDVVRRALGKVQEKE